MAATCSATPWPRAWATTCWAWRVRCSGSATSSWASNAASWRTPIASSAASRPNGRSPSCAWSTCAPPSSISATLHEALHGIDRRCRSTTTRCGRSIAASATRSTGACDCSTTQRDRALQQLNEARRTSRETPLTEIPDESYDAAFHQLFDHPEADEVPSEDELLTMLTAGPARRRRVARARAAPEATGGRPRRRARRVAGIAAGPTTARRPDRRVAAGTGPSGTARSGAARARTGPVRPPGLGRARATMAHQRDDGRTVRGAGQRPAG